MSYSESFSCHCFDSLKASSDRVDRLWDRLTADGGEESQCGWLVDRFGVSWQIVPIALTEMVGSGDEAAIERVSAAFLQMTKLDIAALVRAFRGEQTLADPSRARMQRTRQLQNPRLPLQQGLRRHFGSQRPLRLPHHEQSDNGCYAGLTQGGGHRDYCHHAAY